MMSQPWRCLNECPRVGLVRGRRDRAGFPGRGDAPARTRVTRLRVGKLLARSQSRQTDCPRFSRHTRWPPGTDPSPRETQTTPATTVHSPRETQTTPAPRKTLKYAKKRHAGAVPVTTPPPTPHAGAVPVTSGNLTTSSTHRSDTPVKPRPPQLPEKHSNTPKTPRRGGPGYIWRSHHLFHPQIRHPRETQTTPAPRKTLRYAKKRHAGAVPVTPTQAPRSAGAVPVTPTRTSHHPQGPNGLSRAPPGPSAPASTGCAPRLSQPRAARSATSAFVSSTRSRGLSSTLRPRRPPEMMIVSWSKHEESMNVRWEVVCPSGLMPPTT